MPDLIRHPEVFGFKSFRLHENDKKQKLLTVEEFISFTFDLTGCFFDRWLG